MKALLVTIILCQIFVMGLMGGYSYLLTKQTKKSDQCIREILDSNVELRDYFGHKIDMKDTWIHAQSYVANHYFWCMNRRDK